MPYEEGEVEVSGTVPVPLPAGGDVSSTGGGIVSEGVLVAGGALLCGAGVAGAL